MPWSMHIELTALLEHIQDKNMNVCCMDVCGHFPDNIILALCYIIKPYIVPFAAHCNTYTYFSMHIAISICGSMHG